MQMNISGIRYERFNEKDYNAARELVSYDVDAGENILRVLAEEPKLFITAFIEACCSGPSERACISALFNSVRCTTVSQARNRFCNGKVC
jgi:hypothetical protein